MAALEAVHRAAAALLAGACGGAPGYHGLQAVVRDVGPGGGWPTLTKTNYVEWATVMEVKLQVRHMWEAVWYGDADYDEDRRALDALIAARVHQTARNRTGYCGYRSNRSGPVPVPGG